MSEHASVLGQTGDRVLGMMIELVRNLEFRTSGVLHYDVAVCRMISLIGSRV